MNICNAGAQFGEPRPLVLVLPLHPHEPLVERSRELPGLHHVEGVDQALQRGGVPDVEVVVSHVGEGEVEGVHVGAGEGVGDVVFHRSFFVKEPPE